MLSKYQDSHSTLVGGGNAPICCMPTARKTNKEEEKAEEEEGAFLPERHHSNMAGKLVLEGRVSLKAFLLGLSVLAVPLIRTCFGHLDWVYDYLTETPGKIAICVHTAVINGLLLIIYRGPLYKVGLQDPTNLLSAQSCPIISLHSKEGALFYRNQHLVLLFLLNFSAHVSVVLLSAHLVCGRFESLYL